MILICATNDECESLVANIEFESGVRTVLYLRIIQDSRVVYPRERRRIVRARELSTVVANSPWHWRHVIALKRFAVSFLGLLLASLFSWFSAYRPLLARIQFGILNPSCTLEQYEPI